jgi:hypothetical protein
MKPDIYLKTVLTVIAICLIVTTVKSVPLISTAKAEGSTHCSGELSANPSGGTEPSIGGYQVDITCN